MSMFTLPPGDGHNANPANLPLSMDEMKSMIYRLPEVPPFMLDRDLARIFGVETRVLNQHVKRNPERFPENFRFQLSREQIDLLVKNNTDIYNPYKVSNCDFSENQTVSDIDASEEGSSSSFKKLPYGFTAFGANMAAMVLNTPQAVERSVQIIQAFTIFENMVNGTAENLDEESKRIADKVSSHLDSDGAKLLIEAMHVAMQDPDLRMMEISNTKSGCKVKFHKDHGTPCDQQECSRCAKGGAKNEDMPPDHESKSKLKKGQRIPGRRGFKIEELSEEASAEALDMLAKHVPYKEIEQTIKEKYGESISAAALCRYNRLILN